MLGWKYKHGCWHQRSRPQTHVDNSNSQTTRDSIKERFTRLAELEARLFQLLTSAETTEHELFTVASQLAVRAVDDGECEAARAFRLMGTRLTEARQRVVELRDQVLEAHSEAEALWRPTLDALARAKGPPPPR